MQCNKPIKYIKSSTSSGQAYQQHSTVTQFVFITTNTINNANTTNTINMPPFKYSRWRHYGK